MSWSLFRWVWLLEAPIHVGIPPAGNLDRCRMYIPARNLWAALTEELARREMGEAPENLDGYQTIGEELQKHCRFSYLYPSEQFGGGWKAWLPCFEKGKGLCWKREVDSKILSDGTARIKLLNARPGTAIDPGTDSAAEGSLHETEVVNPEWRGSQESETRVAMTGYLFCKDSSIYTRLRRIELLYLGGDVRYGLGKMVRVEMKQADRFFECDVRLDQAEPQVHAKVMVAHTETGTKEICGSLERLGGWNVGTHRHIGPLFWVPGSMIKEPQNYSVIQEDGTWKTR